MTRRPRSHQLETESRIAFSAVLPSCWIFRDLTPDYGLDGIVEIFDDEGQATGHMFFVQLKATDEIKLDKALVISMMNRTIDYYSTLMLPVLLVVFRAPMHKLYARWIVGESAIPPRNSKSVTIHLAVEDELTPERLATVIQELESLRAATNLGNREIRIQRYYEQRRAMDYSQKDVGISHGVQRFQPGERVLHGVFGLGTVDQESDCYLFVEFDDDELARKFLPGDTWEFTRIDERD